MSAGEREAATVQRARRLRKGGTDVETRLWYVLRNRNLGGLKFSRQVPIGPYFADFLCAEASLIVELDGGQHALAKNYDRKRTTFLQQRGYRVIRFWNNDVLTNVEGVLLTIQTTLSNES